MMRTFVCEFWGIICAVSAVLGILGFVFEVNSSKKVGSILTKQASRVFLVLISLALALTGYIAATSVRVPVVLGMDLSEARRTLINSGLSIQISCNGTYDLDNIVVGQDGNITTYVAQGSTIRIIVRPDEPSP